MTPKELAELHARAIAVPRPWTESEFKDLLKQPAVFLIEQNHGFALGQVIADEAEVLTLVVAPEARRRGVALSLMQAFLNEVSMRGAETVFLEVARDNQAAISLYRQVGFSESGFRKSYFSDPDGGRIDALILRRNLDSPQRQG